jgi:hypothetical protein
MLFKTWLFQILLQLVINCYKICNSSGGDLNIGNSSSLTVNSPNIDVFGCASTSGGTLNLPDSKGSDRVLFLHESALCNPNNLKFSEVYFGTKKVQCPTPLQYVICRGETC